MVITLDALVNDCYKQCLQPAHRKYMPRTINYTPLINDFITSDRLVSYQVFSPQCDIELVGAYLWNSHVCSTLYPLLSAAEIALRNSVDQILTKNLGRFWWSKSKLHFKSFTLGAPDEQAPDAVKKLRRNFSIASINVINEKKKRYKMANHTPTHSEIVAKTEFSTWEFIFDNEFLGPNLIWPTYLGSVITGTWPSTSAKKTLIYTKDLVKTVREFRNRVFHHEPAWKKFGVSCEAEAIAHLHEKIAKIEDLLRLVSPEKLNLLSKNYLISNAYMACSHEEIERFQHKAKSISIKSLAKLARTVHDSKQRGLNIQSTIFKHGKQSFLISPY